MRPRALCIALLVAALWPAVAARAASIGGYFNLGYSRGDTEARDASGGTTNSSSAVFSQRYRLNLSANLFPTVTLGAGGTFERSDVASESDGIEGESTATRILPFIDLALNTPLLTLGAGYSRNEAKATSNGVSFPAQVREQANARFGYRPDGFPTLDLQLGRTESYDKERISHDIVNDFLNVASRYRPAANLQLTYNGAFSKGTDRLQNIESRSASNSGAASYSGRYWRNRIAYSGMYNINNVNTELTAAGGGEISTPLSFINGYSIVGDPQLPLHSNASLTNGNTTDISGINIGFLTLSDTAQRNIGLEISLAAPSRELNTVYVWVNQKLPPEAEILWSWDVYTSETNLQGDWHFLETVSRAPFAPFDNRFEIRFQKVVTRYVKVVTRPLATLPPPIVGSTDPPDFRNIQVTEVQALLRVPAAEAARKSSLTSQTLSLDARVRLLDVPSLNYSVSFFLAKSSAATGRYSLSNALSANHSFNRVFSGSARVSRDDSDDQNGHRVTYTYNASLTAVPLPTLTHNFAYSGRTEQPPGRDTNQFHSLNLTNTAELYKGINANLSGGISFAALDNGVKSESSTLGAGLNLVPHRTLNVNLSYSGTASKQTGGGKPEATSNSSSGAVSASFTPLRTLYLYGDWSFNRQAGQPDVTTNSYAINWAPFPDGTVHFTVSYTETYRSSDESTDRALTPSIRWNITRRASLDASYAWFHSESVSQETRTMLFNTNLRVSF